MPPESLLTAASAPRLARLLSDYNHANYNQWLRRWEAGLRRARDAGEVRLVKSRALFLESKSWSHLPSTCHVFVRPSSIFHLC